MPVNVQLYLILKINFNLNLGSCQVYLGLEDPVLKQHHEDGHVCGDNNGKLLEFNMN